MSSPGLPAAAAQTARSSAWRKAHRGSQGDSLATAEQQAEEAEKVREEGGL
jgi:hypothetical protein